MDKKIILTTGAPMPIGPYSQAVLCGNTLYCSGQIALDSQGNFLNNSIETETVQVMNNIGKLLEAADMGYENIVKTSIFLTDMNDFGTVNSIYASFFNADFPARETIQVSALPKGARVEISVTAIR
jgi:2-iminobutanoate/2-iminopropanoate deaminase